MNPTYLNGRNAPRCSIVPFGFFIKDKVGQLKTSSDIESDPKRKWRLFFGGQAGASDGLKLVFIGIFFAVTLPSFADEPASLPELRTAEQVRRLAPAEAEKHYPVRLRGTLTFFDQRVSTAEFQFIQDETAGIYIFLDAETGNPPLASGQLVEIEGRTGQGAFAPVVWVRRIQILGDGKFPPAKPVSFEQLVSGQQDSQFVEISGIVRNARLDNQTKYFAIEIATGGGRVTAYAAAAPALPEDQLVDSTVKVRGVALSQFNLRRQLFDVRIVVPRSEDITVMQPALNNSFEGPIQPIDSLMRFTPEGFYGHRVKVSGTVIYRQYSDALYIEDGAEGLYVETRQSGALLPGDKVEVLGFPSQGDYSPMLKDAVFRKVGSGALPVPDEVTTDEALKGTHDCRLVRILATVVERAQHSRDEFLVLEAGGFIFHAYLERKNHGVDFAYLENGSQVAVTGVCLIEKGSSWFAGETWRAKSFRLLLRSPGDILLLKRPPWWTLQKMLWAAALLAAVVLATLVWVVVLRNRVHKQTLIISQKLQAEAILKERYQELLENANDMVYTHDLQGRLTSINHAGESLLKRPREAILSRNIIDLVVPEQQGGARQWLAQVLKDSAPPTIEWNFGLASGQPLKVEISARLIKQNDRAIEVEGIARDVTERNRLEQELLDISTREQRRIGHDLHDGVCQQLAGISLLAETAADRLQEKGIAESVEVGRINQLLNKAIDHTRGMARGLFPVRFEENGLLSALEELMASTGVLFQIACHFVCENPPDKLDNTIALHLYYIVQEAIVNAAKHGKARNVRVTLSTANELYSLIVQDDGVGFSQTASGSTGMGLRIMQYRARMIGATCEIKSVLREGTSVTCVFSSAVREGTPKSR